MDFHVGHEESGGMLALTMGGHLWAGLLSLRQCLQVHGLKFRGGHIQPSFVRQVERRRVGGQIGRRVFCPKEAWARPAKGVCYDVAFALKITHILGPLRYFYEMCSCHAVVCKG